MEDQNTLGADWLMEAALRAADFRMRAGGNETADTQRMAQVMFHCAAAIVSAIDRLTAAVEKDRS